eukprot:gene17305-19038_t
MLDEREGEKDIESSEEGEDEEVDASEDEEEQPSISIATPKSHHTKERKQKGTITGRGVTMHMLIDDDILVPGEKLLSIDYLGKKFEGDLLYDGQIRWCETGQIFSSPSSWAMYCKKLVNPTKKSGCGWASVRYKGKKLDQFKSAWFRKQKGQASGSIDQDATKSPIHSSTSKKWDRGLETVEHEQPSRISPIGIHPLFSPMSEHGKGTPDTMPISLPIQVPKPSSLKTPKAPAVKKRIGRPPKNRSLAELPAASHSVDKYGLPLFGSPPHVPSPHQASPKLAQRQMKSPTPDKASHHSRLSDFQTPIPGRTGNVMTFSEALELVKSQSTGKMEQSGTYSRPQTSNVSMGTPRMSAMSHSSASGRVYKRKPGRPPKDPNKQTVKSIGQIMPPNSAMSSSLTPSRGRGKRFSRTRMSMKHANVHAESDPLTLVECAQFASIGKIQPFSITISTNALLLIDFHCHLSTSEVIGYLAGKWDTTRHHLKISQAFPCKSRIADKEDGNEIEAQIRKDIELSGQTLVGWYHSHPFCQPDPTLQDIKNQLDYQHVVKDDDASEPCIGLIVSPYDSHKKEAVFKAFWVQSHAQMHPEKLPLPLGMNFTTQQDQQLTQDIVNEMVALVNYYKGSPDSIVFTDTWTSESTYLDKIKVDHAFCDKKVSSRSDGWKISGFHDKNVGRCQCKRMNEVSSMTYSLAAEIAKTIALANRKLQYDSGEF